MQQHSAEAAAPSSRERFLAAAAEEFIAHGYDRCTIRAIAARAGTSAASFSRNWKDKRQLFAELFKIQFEPINMAQHAAFDRLQLREETTLTDMIAGFYRPVLAPLEDRAGNVERHRVYCQALADPSLEARELFRPLVADVRSRLINIVRSFLPHLDDQSLFLAMNVIHGTYLYPQLHGRRLAGNMGMDEAAIDWNGAAERLARMVVNGIGLPQYPPA